MDENMTVWVEAWPLAADKAGIWLLSDGDAWRFGPVKAVSDVHYEIEWLLFQHDIDPENAKLFIPMPAGTPGADVIHSTSWRPEPGSIMLTYMAVVNAGGYVRERWPAAMPLSEAFARAFGRQEPHAATAPPVPPLSGVLLHGIRHLKFLAGPEGDAETAAALDENWRRHMAPLKPALATMYSERLTA